MLSSCLAMTGFILVGKDYIINISFSQRTYIYWELIQLDPK